MEDSKQCHPICKLFLDGDPLAVTIELELNIKKSLGGGVRGMERQPMMSSSCRLTSNDEGKGISNYNRSFDEVSDNGGM